MSSYPDIILRELCSDLSNSIDDLLKNIDTKKELDPNSFRKISEKALAAEAFAEKLPHGDIVSKSLHLIGHHCIFYAEMAKQKPSDLRVQDNIRMQLSQYNASLWEEINEFKSACRS